MTDTTTLEGLEKRGDEITAAYWQSGNKAGLIRMAGLSQSDWDESPEDAGEPPEGAN